MNQIYLLPFNQRIGQYKEFRKQLKDKSLTEQLELTMEWFKNWPLVNRLIDIDSCQHWLTPWEFLKENCLCENAKVVLLHETICMLNDDFEKNSKILLINDRNKEIVQLVILYNNELLNYCNSTEKFSKTNENMLVQRVFIKSEDGYIEIDRNQI